MGWHKNNLIGKTKAGHISEEKQGIHSDLPMGRLVFSLLQERIIANVPHFLLLSPTL